MRLPSLGDQQLPKPSPDGRAAGKTWIQFDFFLPEFSGYTPENIRKAFDVNKVEVGYVIAADTRPGAGPPGQYPPDQLKRTLQYLADPNDHRDTYELRCYQGRVLKDRMYCYGSRDKAAQEDILFDVMIPPYASGVVNPQMRTTYFTRRYGGVVISWRTNVRNLPRWHDIDQHIWQFIESWNLAEPRKSATPP
jgi:hypothetical protein